LLFHRKNNNFFKNKIQKQINTKEIKNKKKKKQKKSKLNIFIQQRKT